MDFERFKKINDERMNYREMEDASVVSSYRNLGCGDGYRLYLKVEGDKVVDASYTTTGCGFGLVSLAMATQWITGKTIEQAGSIQASDIEGMFEFPDRRKNYPESAVEAVQKAVADFKNGTGIRPEDRVSRTTALEALARDGHLRGAKLNQIILEGENLEGVDATGADFSNAFLQNVNFRGANLSGARFRGAFLNNANLEGANLSGSDLRWAKLTGARLEGVQVQGATYDIGTRMDANRIHLFKDMVQAGKDAYVEKEAGVG